MDDNGWFCHFITLAQKINCMFHSSFGNTLDTTLVSVIRNGAWVEVEQWDKDMLSVMNFMKTGNNAFKIPISPLCHTLCHTYDMLLADTSNGLGNFSSIIFNL